MVQSSWPSPDDSRVVDDLQYETVAANQYIDGLNGSLSDSALVYADGVDRRVFVRGNRTAQLRGHGWSSGTSDLTLAITANSSGSVRTDLVVLGLDRATWNVTAYVKDGTPGAGAPALQVDTGSTGKYEMPIAEVTVPNGATTISAAQVKTRAWYARPGRYAAPGSTADTRPPNPKSGDILWQADTEYVWNGTIWDKISNLPTPTQTFQNEFYQGTSGPSGIGGDSTWRRFTALYWPVLSFIVPPSGRYHVTISGFIENRYAANSVIWISYAISGGGAPGGTADNLMGLRGISARGGRNSASRRSLFTGMTPGATVTVTPYYLSSAASPSGDITSMRYGVLEMEPA